MGGSFECADEVRSLARAPKLKRISLELLTITACRCCLGLTVYGIFTSLFFKTFRVRGLVGRSEVCITSDDQTSDTS